MPNEVPPNHVTRFAALFEGLDRAYGIYTLDGIKREDGKADGSGLTIREDLLPEHYAAHLAGDAMLGVVPIMDGNHCLWGGIDIDDYQIDIPATLVKLRDVPLSLCPLRSKSGGLHVVAFFSHPIPAKLVMAKLEAVADYLGYPGIEIFPKQTKLGPEDVGNWLNIGWFNAADSDRHGYDVDTGESITDLGAWLDYAEGRRLTFKDLNRCKLGTPDNGELFQDGPPCLQAIARQGIPDGQRNMTMFPMAIYCHHKTESDPDAKAMVHELNAALCSPLMDDREVDQIINQAIDGEYRYPCAQAPIKEHCDRTTCLRRKWGVRLNGESFNFGTLWQFVPVTDDGTELRSECRWRLQVTQNGTDYTAEFSTAELRSYRAVSAAFMNHRIVLPNFDANDWMAIIEEKVPACEVVHVPADTTHVGELARLVSEFVNLRGKFTESKIEILHGKVWRDEDDDNRYKFHRDHLVKFLIARNFKVTGTPLVLMLKERSGMVPDRIYMTPSNKQQRIWTLPESALIQGVVEPITMNVKEVF